MVGSWDVPRTKLSHELLNDRVGFRFEFLTYEQRVDATDIEGGCDITSRCQRGHERVNDGGGEGIIRRGSPVVRRCHFVIPRSLSGSRQHQKGLGELPSEMGSLLIHPMLECASIR